MKYTLFFITFFIFLFTFSLNICNWSNSLFDNSNEEIPYCNDDWECWVIQWIEAVKDIEAVENEKKASQYIQDIVKYILSFLALVATLIIIYAWFTVLISVWDEEKTKKSKQMIIYSIIWLVIIFMAWPIINFVIDVLNVG